VPTYRLVVEYDGTRFHGLQWQRTLRTVAGVLEDALAPIFGDGTKITAAGRTDAGVHATGQVISFRAERVFPVVRLALALNDRTPADVVVRSAEIVDDGFSARFSTIERSYDYLILNRPFPSAIWRDRAWFVPKPIDDFATYCGVKPTKGTTVRTLHAIDLERRDDVVRISVRGNAFLHRMIRVMVGTLTECALGVREVAFAGEALAKCDRTAGGLTAPAHGLYFAGVRYADLDTYRPVRLAP
jgi:tRNA pseudouridine38-40 synthase